VQKADSLSLFDELDAALQSGSSTGRAVMLRRATDLLPAKADHLRTHGKQTVSLPLPAIAARNSSENDLAAPLRRVREAGARSARYSLRSFKERIA
jgi:hypothetical protein